MINVGLIGVGYWGNNYLRIIDQTNKARLVRTCDLKQDNTVSELIPHTLNYRDIAQDPNIDAVIIASSASTHYEIASEMLRSGKHVLVEKPLALSSRECNELIGLAEQYDLSLMAGHIYTFNSAVDGIREIVQRGVLGKPVSFTSQRLNDGPIRSDVDAMWDLAIHDITILNKIFGLKPTKIFVNKRYDDITRSKMPNCSLINLSYGDIQGVIESDWLYHSKVRLLRIIFEHGFIIFDETQTPNLKIYKTVKGKNNELKIKLPIGGSEPLKSELQYFIDSVQDRSKSRLFHSDYLSIIKTLELGDQSFKKQKALEL